MEQYHVYVTWITQNGTEPHIMFHWCVCVCVGLCVCVRACMHRKQRMRVHRDAKLHTAAQNRQKQQTMSNMTVTEQCCLLQIQLITLLLTKQLEWQNVIFNATSASQTREARSFRTELAG